MLSAVSKRSSALTKTATVFLLGALGFLLAPASSLGSQPEARPKHFRRYAASAAAPIRDIRDVDQAQRHSRPRQQPQRQFVQRRRPAVTLASTSGVRVKRGGNIASPAQVGPARVVGKDHRLQVPHFLHAALPAKLQNVRRSNWRQARRIGFAADAALARSLWRTRHRPGATRARPHGDAPHAQRRQHERLDGAGPGPRLHAFATGRRQGSALRLLQSVERRSQMRRRGRAHSQRPAPGVYGGDSSLANLYVSMLDAFGTPVERFADSTDPLAGLLADKSQEPHAWSAAAGPAGRRLHRYLGRTNRTAQVGMALRFSQQGAVLNGKLYDGYKSPSIVEGKVRRLCVGCGRAMPATGARSS